MARSLGKGARGILLVAAIAAAVAALVGAGFALRAKADEGAPAVGRVRGVVRFAGQPPARAEIKPTKDPAVCGKQPLYDESILVGDGGGLANAVVSLEGVPGAKAPPPRKATVDQASCRYEPHVQAVPVGSELALVNSDATLHNVHGILDGETIFNVALASAGTRSKQKLADAGVVELKCDAGHTWMHAYVLAFEHPYYAVTGADGHFVIEGVPPGKHAAVVWHEKLGTRKATVEVTAGGEATLEVTMGGK